MKFLPKHFGGVGGKSKFHYSSTLLDSKSPPETLGMAADPPALKEGENRRAQGTEHHMFSRGPSAPSVPDGSLVPWLMESAQPPQGVQPWVL